MNAEQTVVPPGGQHYSAQNRVPNIQEFVQSLDRQKKERDAAIDEQLKQNKVPAEAKDQTNAPDPKHKTTRKVRDPVTGKDVDIQDADTDFAEAVDNPKVSNSNRTAELPWAEQI